MGDEPLKECHLRPTMILAPRESDHKPTFPLRRSTITSHIFGAGIRTKVIGEKECYCPSGQKDLCQDIRQRNFVVYKDTSSTRLTVQRSSLSYFLDKVDHLTVVLKLCSRKSRPTSGTPEEKDKVRYTDAPSY